MRTGMGVMYKWIIAYHVHGYPEACTRRPKEMGLETDEPIPTADGIFIYVIKPHCDDTVQMVDDIVSAIERG